MRHERTREELMKSRIVTAALFFLATIPAHAQAGTQDLAGDWQGTLSAGGQQLRLVLHITKAPDGSLKATLDSIDQPGANGIPVSSIALKDSKLSLEVAMVHGTYEGKVAADGKIISGTWTQAQPLPLEFKRADTPVQPAKPSDIDGTWM